MQFTLPQGTSQRLVETLRLALRAAAPQPRLSISEWADEYRYLSAEDSAEKGKYRCARAEYQRGIMDACTEPNVTDVVGMLSAQVGKTQILNNILGYTIDVDPCPILVVHSNEQLARDWSSDRFTPMLRDTPALHGKIRPNVERKGGNNTGDTRFHKRFPGGYVSIAWGSSPSGIAGRPVRRLLADEIDRWPDSIPKEGDPWEIAKARVQAFPESLRVAFSTPTTRSGSRINRLWEDSDQRRYFVPCRHCGVFQLLRWASVRWSKDERGEHDPATAHYECEACQGHMDDSDLHRAVSFGEWRAMAPFNGTAGFHLNAIYSPFTTLRGMVADFLRSKDDPELLQAFVNLQLGEPYEDEFDKVDDDPLFARREEFAAPVPQGGLVLTAGVDTQDDRLEGEIVAWGMGEESWSVDYFTVLGDPNDVATWKSLDEILATKYKHESGAELTVERVCIDSAGHRSDAVYNYCRQRQPRVIATIGRDGDRQLVASPIKRKSPTQGRRAVRLFTVGVDTGKAHLYSRLRIETPGPGYCHFPLDAEHDEEYFAQLTAEKLVTTWQRGQRRQEWVKTRKRNEALDCRILAMAAFAILSPNLSLRAKRLAVKVEAPKSAPTELEPVPVREVQHIGKKKARPQRPRGSSWRDSWRS